jgi:soluble lytic murein transglycosylase
MREESEYRPSVSSPAGALGLMQLIPPTANRVAEKLGVVGFEPNQLFDPATNIASEPGTCARS